MQGPENFNYRVEGRHVRNAFNGAAKNYDRFSALQQTVSDRLIESFEHIKINPETVLDLGSGTGFGSKHLKLLFKKTKIYELDVSIEMLKSSRNKYFRLFKKNRFICAEANKIPLSDNSIDLVFSNLMLQWCNDPDAVFSEVARVLKPDGVFIFSSFGPDTLKELRESWQQVDSEVHVNAFTDMHDIGDALVRNGMDAPVLSVEHIVLTYDKCKQLMRELKNIGAHNTNQGRRKTLTGKQRLEKVIKHYELFRQNNKLPATYEVIYGHAWNKAVNKHSSNSGAQTISLDSLRQDLKNRKL